MQIFNDYMKQMQRDMYAQASLAQYEDDQKDIVFDHVYTYIMLLLYPRYVIPTR